MISPPSRSIAPRLNFRQYRFECGVAVPGRGFTLLEMLIVLLLLSIIVAVSAPATGRFLASLEFRKETQAIRATLNQARLMAVTSGKKVTVTLEEDQPALRVAGPAKVINKIGNGKGEVTLRPDEIIFLPEGRATPAVVGYRRDDRSWQINIDPLTGLTIEE